MILERDFKSSARTQDETGPTGSVRDNVHLMTFTMHQPETLTLIIETELTRTGRWEETADVLPTVVRHHSNEEIFGLLRADLLTFGDDQG